MVIYTKISSYKCITVFVYCFINYFLYNVSLFLLVVFLYFCLTGPQRCQWFKNNGFYAEQFKDVISSGN